MLEDFYMGSYEIDICKRQTDICIFMCFVLMNSKWGQDHDLPEMVKNELPCFKNKTMQQKIERSKALLFCWCFWNSLGLIPCALPLQLTPSPQTPRNH